MDLITEDTQLFRTLSSLLNLTAESSSLVGNVFASQEQYRNLFQFAHKFAVNEWAPRTEASRSNSEASPDVPEEHRMQVDELSQN